MRRLCKLLIVVFCLVFIFGAADAFAKKKKKKKLTRKQKEELRQDDIKLGGHLFFRPTGFPLAIPTTNIGVNLGYTYTTWKFDEPRNLIFLNEDEFHAGGISEMMNVEFEFLNRFSMEVMLEGRALVGADEMTAVFFGGDGSFSGGLIPKVMAYQNDDWGMCLSFSADLLYNNMITTSPAILIDGFLKKTEQRLIEYQQTGDVPSMEEIERLLKIDINDALIRNDVFSVRPSFLLAQRIHPVFGVQIGVRYDVGLYQKETLPSYFYEPEGDQPPRSFIAGTMLSLDLNPISKAHLGFKGEFDYINVQDDADQMVTYVFGGGLIYTGRKNLDLGATYLQALHMPEGVTQQIHSLFLNLRYIF